MVVKGPLVNTINDHIQFTVVIFLTTGDHVVADNILLMTTFKVSTTIGSLVNITAPSRQCYQGPPFCGRYFS